MKGIRKTEKDEERDTDRGNITKRQIFFYLVSIWHTSGILMTGQSR